MRVLALASLPPGYGLRKPRGVAHCYAGLCFKYYHLLQSMRLPFDRVPSLCLHSEKESKIASDHQATLRAVRAGDKAEATAQVTRHLSRYR